MTPDGIPDDAIEALTTAMALLCGKEWGVECPGLDKHRVEASYLWSNIDKAALRAALLGDVREEVLELAAVNHRHIFPGRWVVARDDVLRLLGGE